MKRPWSTPGTWSWTLPVHRPWLVVLASLLLAGAALVLLSRLHASSVLESMFSGSNPTVQAYLDMQQSLESKDEIIIVAHDDSDSSTTTESETRLLSFALRLQDAIESSNSLLVSGSNLRYRNGYVPDIARYYEEVVVPNALHYLQPDDIDALLVQLTPDRIKAQIEQNERLVAAPGSASAIADQVLKDPLRIYEFLGQRLSDSGFRASEPWFSSDKRHLLIRITGSTPVSDMDYTRSFVNAIQEMAQRVNGDGLLLEYTGAYPIAELSERSIRSDMITSVFWTLALLFIVFLIGYRSCTEYVVAGLSIGMAILVAFGLFALLHSSLNPATAVAGAILAGLGVDYSVHVMSHVSHESANQNQEPRLGIPAALRKVAVPVAIAGTTTIIAFVAVSRSSVQALQEFSLLAAIGIACSVIAALILLPALLYLFRVVPFRLLPKRDSTTGLPRRLVRRISDAPGTTISACIVVWLFIIIAAWWMPGAGARGDQLSEMHPHPNPPLEIQKRIVELFSESDETLFVWIDSNKATDLLRSAWSVTAELERDNSKALGVVSTLSIASLLPDPSDPAYRLSRLPSFEVDRFIEEFEQALDQSIFNPDSYDQYVAFLRRLLTSSTPPDLGNLAQFPSIYRQLVGTDEEGAPIGTVVVADIGGDRPEMDELIPELDRRISQVPGATLTGISAIGQYVNEAVGSELFTLMAYALIIILAFLMIIFRSIGSVLLVLLPCLFTLPFVFGIMRLLGIEFNMINLIGVPLLIGIGIDDGIFVVSIALHGRRNAVGRDALLSRFRSVCHAMLVTTATTALAFGSLVFTSTPAIQSLGVVTAVGVLGCLASTIAVLLPILLLLHPAPEPRTTVEHS
ncbi:MAG: hypothetical protein CBC35_02770 [Planctomycetes bacterium TMED75]|nr:hypothetical protein [Planctomycetaceae bacterium]OUU95318.1 MAG: hypothetical protein CBC35_02770 [Planctomycetes bacterium TMED75]